eukprot:CAMPEP_0115152420 /NCGR_PEP_ID=MMETSP0227-20121206/66151_1 /TAXON_ID=89957 /ORGANISM="Polarella glacialis, Strain CCMP 1383" /LENGTH=119 /DNA_ID=CAMNT_0002563027 /DNA_START=281 /DNA_END=641 /DNA_ORIENTATION=+
MTARLGASLVDVPPPSDGLSESVVPGTEDVGDVEGDQQGLADQGPGPQEPEEVRLAHARSVDDAVLHAADACQALVRPGVGVLSPPRRAGLQELPEEILRTLQLSSRDHICNHGVSFGV